MKPTSAHPLEILLVDDNLGDVVLTKHAFADAKIKNSISVAKDGEEAMEFLYKRGAFKNAPTPDIILLDLNMPKKDGKEVLADIKNDATLRRIPVVIMSSSRAEQDVLKTYDLHANSYLIKPVDIMQFSDIVNAIEGFWFSIVKLPHTPEGGD